MQARVPDPTKIFVSVGLGFFAELSLDEALAFIAKKDGQLSKQVWSQDEAPLQCVSPPGRAADWGLRQAEGQHQAGAGGAAGAAGDQWRGAEETF